MKGTLISENVQEPKKGKVETIGEDKVETPINDGRQSQKGQANTPTPLAQDQGATEIKEVEKDKFEETNSTPKPKKLVAIQALVILPELVTPSNKILQRPSIDSTPLQFLVLSPSSSKAEEVITYGDVSLDGEIVLPKFDYATITIEQMGILQEALARKKHQELLRREKKAEARFD